MKKILFFSVALLAGGLAGTLYGAEAAASTLDDQLLAAIKSGERDLVEQLLDQGANVNAADEHGVTAYMEATVRRHIDIRVLLRQQGANVKAKDKWGNTAMSLLLDMSRR